MCYQRMLDLYSQMMGGLKLNAVRVVRIIPISTYVFDCVGPLVLPICEGLLAYAIPGVTQQKGDLLRSCVIRKLTLESR